MQLNESFVIHETLNEKLFDSAGILYPDVRQKILSIVENFEKTLSIPIYILDVEIVGSQASYNYSETSDLDIEIVANFELIDAPKEILQTAYYMKKCKYNEEHDITIHGIDVELYVQDVRSGIVSNGIYSVCDNQWIKQPKPIKSITKHNTEKELEKWKTHVANILRDRNKTEIQECINTIFLIRRNSLATGGEFAKGNQLFKDIKAAGLIDQLKAALAEAESRELSLESLASEYSNGQILNRLDLVE